MSSSLTPKRLLLDGRYRWGTATRQTGRYGAESIHLTIYPPDTPTHLRRFARLARLWPFIAAALVIFGGFAVPAVVDVPMLVAVVSIGALVILIGAVLVRISAPVRTRTASILVTVSAITPQDADQRRYDDAVALLTRLHVMEDAFDRGSISPDDYGAAWTSAYQHLWTELA